MARAAAAAFAAVLLVAVPSAGGEGVQVPRPGGTVVFWPVSEPACLNVYLDACSANGSNLPFWIAAQVLEGAFEVAPDQTFRPKLVSRVAFTRKPPFTLTYLIRPQARWSDGVPITARDFVFTHRAIKRLEPYYEETHLKQVLGVRALDSKTVRVVLRSRFAGWRTLFRAVLPAHALVGADLARAWSGGIVNPKTGKPIGNGPFLVEDWERGGQLVLRRNADYWGRHAYLGRLVLRFCQAGCGTAPPTDALAALRQGTVDIVFGRETGIIPDLRRIPRITVRMTPSTGWEHLDIQVGAGGHPALRSKLVRRALAYGIDRIALVRQVVGDINGNYRVSDSAIFPSYSRYYRRNWSRYRYRPERAKLLLRQSGCRPGADGVFLCAGERLALRLVTTSGTPFREQIARLVQAHLRPVGIEVLPSFVSRDTFFDRVLPSGGWDLALFAWIRDPDRSREVDAYGCGGFQNNSGYCQRLLTRELNQAALILDADKQARVLNKSDVALARDVPVIPLLQNPFVVGFRQSIRDIVVGPDNPISTAEDWWLAQGR